MSRPGIFYRPRLNDPTQLRAWKLLQAVPERQRGAFLTRAILQTEEKLITENRLREIIREELAGAAVSPPPAAQPAEVKKPEKNELPQGMLDFLGELMNQ